MYQYISKLGNSTIKWGLYLLFNLFVLTAFSGGQELGQGSILFNRSNNEDDLGVYTINLNSSEVSRLTPIDMRFTATKVSNKGNRILGLRLDSISHSLSIFDWNGVIIQQVTNSSQLIPTYEQWSSDDKNILFWARIIEPEDPNRSWSIFKVFVEDRLMDQLTLPSEEMGGLGVAPDDSQVLYTQNNQLYSISLTGGEANPIQLPFHTTQMMAWKPDATRIALVGFGQEEGDELKDNIWIITPNGSDVQLLASDIGMVSKLIWSSDGSKLLFLSDDKRGGNPIALGIVSLSDNSTNIYRMGEGILSNLDYISSAVWSPDGTQIAFSAYDNDDETQNLYVVDYEFQEIQRLTEVNARENVVYWRYDE
jgi:Tol biopolymer transport system component